VNVSKILEDGRQNAETTNDRALRKYIEMHGKEGSGQTLRKF